MANITGIFRIGRDAETRFTPTGDAVCSLSLAFNFYDKTADKNKGSQWIEAALFGKRAESLAPYLLKGSQVYAVINDPHVESYPKKDGTTGTRLVGKISEIEFAGSKAERSEHEIAPAQTQPAKTSRPQQVKAADDDFSDDIPF
jgi:single-strand DNA-binding protein